MSSQFLVASAADDALDPLARNTTLLSDLLAAWNETHAGILADPGTNHVGWLRFPDDDPIWETYKDPSAGPTSPHYELLFRVCTTRFCQRLRGADEQLLGWLCVHLGGVSPVDRKFLDHQHRSCLSYLPSV